MCLSINRLVTVWSLDGEKITTFEDHALWPSESNTNTIYITVQQEYILSFCKDKTTGKGKN